MLDAGRLGARQLGRVLDGRARHLPQLPLLRGTVSGQRGDQVGHVVDDDVIEQPLPGLVLVGGEHLPRPLDRLLARRVRERIGVVVLLRERGWPEDILQAILGIQLLIGLYLFLTGARPQRIQRLLLRRILEVCRNSHLERADLVVENDYAFPMVTHFAIEPHAFMAAPDGDGIAN